MELQDSIIKIKGVGEKTAVYFKKLGIFTIQQLLEHYPKGYDVYENLVSIESLREGETAAIEASLLADPKVKRVRNLTIVNCQVRDSSASLSLTWFNMPFLKNTLRIGTKYIFRGKVVRKEGVLTIEQPKILGKEEFYNQLHILKPCYPLTAGLTNRAVEKAEALALKEAVLTGDYLPLEVRKRYGLEDYKTALRNIHFPKNKEAMYQARKRIVFDEFFLLALAMHQLKRQKNRKKSPYPMEKEETCRELIRELPYELTNAQKKVWEEIERDMTSSCVMNRLVQGDVGSGKTVLAALALLLNARNGCQGTIMVPTEVLARQHYGTLKGLLDRFGVRIVLLTGSMKAKEKKEIYHLIRTHQADVIVGTHALIQEAVEYEKLALVVTDEQHRFGVRQREALSGKGIDPHILVMSATPIPRTLAIILYGDLDLSVLDELPAKRLSIKNCVVNSHYRKTAYRFLEKETAAGHQVYVICPIVEESETLEAENVMDYTLQLKEELPPSVKIEYLHGKMKAAEKNDIMEKFTMGEIDVLVSTTVVEVGVNVPNATVMMIENAERFGLAQLHQLRGRVGRGESQSYCILVSGSENKEIMERLEILNQSNDGFFIAGEDLRLRGPGDLFGIRQSGMLEFKMADVFQDAKILEAANAAAKTFTEEEYKLLLKQYGRLREKIILFTGETAL